MLLLVKEFLEEARSNYADATRHSIASQRIGSRNIWKTFTSIVNKVSLQIPPLFNGSVVLTYSKDKANRFAMKLSVNSFLDDTLHNLPDFSLRTEQEIFSMRITARMVANAISEFDVANATGPDCIPSIVLKMCSPELSPVFAKLYNKCLFESYFSSSWTVSSVVPA